MKTLRPASIFFSVLFALASLPCRAADRNQAWTEIRSPHFTVLCNSGEREGRHVAQQFESMRALFHTAFPKLHVDFGKPTLVFALRNEDSLKLFIPGYGLNPKAKKIAGLFMPSIDMNFALVRTDISSTAVNEYHALYHEYTHAIMRLNFRGLPLWLDEGFADFFGGTRFDGSKASFGMVETAHLHQLQTEPFIPIATLVTADTTSPLYNSREHEGMFYAESWALVHYFMIDKEVREKALLNKFLSVLQATDDPVEAAQQSFGDLKKLEARLQEYARQQTFLYSRIDVDSGTSEKDFTARPMPLAEALTQQANFLLRSGHSAEALNDLHEAEAADAKLPQLHDALGYYHYLRSDNDNALKEYEAALALDANDAAAYYHKAQVLYRKNGYSKENLPIILPVLEKAAALEPNFAPTHGMLSVAYTRSEETKAKSIAQADAAITLEPGNLAFYLDLGRAALANGKTDDAKTIAERAQKSATSPRDRAMAASFAKSVANYNPAKVLSVDTEGATPAPAASEDAASASSATEASTEGQITGVICGKPPQVTLILSSDKEQMLLHVADISKIEIRMEGKDSSATAMPCSQWKDKKAKIVFEPTPDGSAHGEVRSVDFL